MAFEGCNVGGLLTDAKNTMYDKSLLFNVKAESIAQTTTFAVDTAGVINVDTAGDSGTPCGGITPNCHDYSSFSVTADHSITVNEIIAKCVDNLTPQDLTSFIQPTARKWSNTEVAIGYNDLLPDFGDLTNEMKAIKEDGSLETVKAEALYMIEKLVEKGFSEDQIVLVLGSKAKYEDFNEELGCCDIGVASAQAGQILGNKLGIAGVYYITEKNVISGNITGEKLTDDNTVRMMAYVKELQPYNEFCVDEPTLEDFNDAYTKKSSHFIGSEKVAAKSLPDLDPVDSSDVATGYVEYQSVVPTI